MKSIHVITGFIFLTGLVMIEISGGIPIDIQYGGITGPESSGGEGWPARELSATLVRDGWALLRAGREDAAADAVAIAELFSRSDAATALLAASDERRQRKSELLSAIFSEAKSIGDTPRAGRLGEIISKLDANRAQKPDEGASDEEKIHLIIEDAKGHAREGRIAQARASIEEAMERSPSNPLAAALLSELAGLERGRPSKDSNCEEAEELFAEGMKLKKSGDDFASCRLFGQALSLIRSEPVPPPSAASIEKARHDCLEELQRLAEPILEKHRLTIERAVGADPKSAILALKGAREELSKLTGAVPGYGGAGSIMGELNRAMKAACRRWIAGALAVEKFSGCAKALPIYEDIAGTIFDVDFDARLQADDGFMRCGGSPSVGGKR